MKTVLSIAGSDASGGAGIQADLKTITLNGCYAMSAITALTAQNTLGVRGILEIPGTFVEQQINGVFEDIYPNAVKIGMLSSPEIIEAVSGRLRFYEAGNIIVDPVMVATSGSRLMKQDALASLTQKLFPIATLVTPNIPEAEVLSGMSVSNKEEMETAAKWISLEFDCAVLIKGGHNVLDANDILYADGEVHWIEGGRIENPNTHGTGCTLSSAIAANLAKGFSVFESVKRGKEYITGALMAGLDLGHGFGPLNHAFDLNGYFTEEK